MTQGTNDQCLEGFLASNFLFVLRGLIPRGTTFEFEYFREIETEFKNILGYQSGVHMGLIHEKNQRPKISCFSPFKQLSIFQ
jgi:hypothetical protein